MNNTSLALATRRAAWILMVAFSTSCSGWVRLPGPPSQPQPEFRQFQVWSRDRMITLHSLQVRHDSLVGIPTANPRGCEECRIAIPAAAVDSVKTGGMGNESAYALGTLMGATAGFFVVLAIALGGME
jgi:hypothetical protein